LALLTDKSKERNSKQSGSHQLKKDCQNKHTAQPAKCKPQIPNFNTGGSVYVQMSQVMNAINISNDSESQDKHEQQLLQKPKGKQLVVKADDDENHEDEDNEDQDLDCIPYISPKTVDSYPVSTIGHLEEHTQPLHRDAGLLEEAIYTICRPLQKPFLESMKHLWMPPNRLFKKYSKTPRCSQLSGLLRAQHDSMKTW